MRVMQASVIPLLVVLLVTQCYLVGMSLLVTVRYQSHVQASEYMHNIGDVVLHLLLPLIELYFYVIRSGLLLIILSPIVIPTVSPNTAVSLYTSWQDHVL